MVLTPVTGRDGVGVGHIFTVM